MPSLVRLHRRIDQPPRLLLSQRAQLGLGQFAEERDAADDSRGGDELVAVTLREVVHARQHFDGDGRETARRSPSYGFFRLMMCYL